MTLASFTYILWRQRWSVVPALIVAVWLCLAVVVTSPPTYRASGSVVLLNPPSPPQAQVGGPAIPDDWQNPYVRIGNLSVIVDLMVRVMGSDQVANDLVAAGFDGTAEIAGNRDYYSGPIVDLAVEAKSEEQAIEDVDLLTAAFNDQLDQLQQGTIEQYRIRAEPVAVATEATTVFSHTLRLLIVAIGFGGILVVGTAIISDRLRGRRAVKAAVGPSAAEISEPHAQVGVRADASSERTSTARTNERRSFRRRRDKTTEAPHAPDHRADHPETDSSGPMDGADDFPHAADEIIDLAAAGAGNTERRPWSPG